MYCGWAMFQWRLLWGECWFWVENRRSAIFVDGVIPGEVGVVGGQRRSY